MQEKREYFLFLTGSCLMFQVFKQKELGVDKLQKVLNSKAKTWKNEGVVQKLRILHLVIQGD